MFRSFKEFTTGNDVNFNIIDLHCDSHGAEYQKRSILYTVSKLLNSGVLSSNIYVIAEFSQPNRLLIELPKEDASYILSNTSESEGTFILNNKFERLNDSYEYIVKHKSLNVIFGDRVYINPELDDFNEYEDNHKYYLKSFVKNSHITHKTIDRYESYLTNILFTQTFLKAAGINYTFFLMNNTFEGYFDNMSHRYASDDIHNILRDNNIKLPSLKNTKHIKDFSQYLSVVWSMLDLNQFVFYKTDRFEYGGIDEYAMENFGNISYLSSANAWDIPEDNHVAFFGSHPHDSVYVNFFADYIYPKIHHYIGKLHFDFSDRWNITKHNSIRL
jgi:hypothetical protein